MPENVETNRERIRVVSLLIDCCDLDSARSRIKTLIGSGGYVACANVHMTMEAADDPEFAELVNSADLVVADGKPIAVMQKRLGAKHSTQIRGFDLMVSLMKMAEKDKIKVGIFGSSGKTLSAFKGRAHAEFPELDIAFAFSPPHIAGEVPLDKTVVDKINRDQIGILFVALGCPKQEKWMAKSRGKLDAVQIGVGAAVDFYAGTAAEAPEFLQHIGLEWLVRFWKEPKRLWRRYLLNNPRFIYRAAKQLLTKAPTKRPR